MRFGLLLFCCALTLRLVCLFAFRWHAEVDGQSTWSWGYEAAGIARSVEVGDGFANPWMRAEPPFQTPTGATGWLAPAYPLLLASLMRVFGVLTLGMAAALFTLQSLLSSLTCVLVWRCGVLAGAARAGRLAGWLFAVHPYSIWNAGHTVWDTTLLACALSAFLWLLLRPASRSSTRHLAWLGCAYGLLLLVNPLPLAGAPLIAWWIAREQHGWRARCLDWAVFGCCALLVCLPWLVRNRIALGSASLRSNFGVELMIGNHPGADGYFARELHPSYSPEEIRRYRELGEVAYAREARQRALSWIRSEPLGFLGLCLRREQIYWLGDPPPCDPRVDERGRHAVDEPRSWIKWGANLVVGLLGLAGLIVRARRSPEWLLLLGWALCLSIPCGLTHALERYRFPSEPLLVLGAAVSLLAMLDRGRQRVSSAHGT